MALSGGGGSGAGFGFVGATFGQTDLVSPYLQMKPQEQVQIEPAKALELPDLKAVNDRHQQMFDIGVQSLIDWETTPEVFEITLAEQQGSLTPEQHRIFSKVNNIKREKRTGLERMMDNFNKSEQTYEEILPQIKSPQSEYYTRHNINLAENYVRGLDLMGELQREGNVSVQFEGSNPFFVTKENEEVMQELDAIGANYQIVDGNLFIDPKSDAFSLDKGKFVKATNPTDVASSVQTPITTTIVGNKDKEGNYYKKGDTFLDLDKFKDRMAFDVMVSPNAFRAGADRVQLTVTGEIQAERDGILPDKDGYYSREDAERVLDTMVFIGASQQGFKRERTSGEAQRTTGSGVRQRINPNSIITTSEDGREIPIRSLNDVSEVAQKTADGFENIPNVQPTGAISFDMPSKPFDVGQDGVKVYPTDLAKDKDGNVYYRVMVNPDEFNLLDAKKQELWRTRMFKKGLLNQKESNKSKWILAKKEEMSTISSIMGLEEDYENITNPAERIRTLIQDGDRMRSGVMQQGISSYYEDEDDSEEKIEYNSFYDQE